MRGRYRKRAIEVEAMHWSGGDWSVLEDFCGRNWSRADAAGVDTFEDEEQVVVWNTKERQWLQVPVGHWIIRGICGELYPCDPGVFDATYEAT